jgi:tRNA pseudouridine38-40 synthase
VDVTPETVLGEHSLTVRIVGSGFLHSMVRVIVGSLVEVGTGRREPAWFQEVLTACDRAAAGPTSPPHGLTLWHVSYPEECWL